MTAPGTIQVPLWTKPYALTVAATFFLFIPYFLFLPILPVYILEELHGSPAVAGAVNGIFLIALVLFRAQTDRIESTFGKRKVLFVAALLFACSNFLFLLVEETKTILILRFFSGACFAIASTSLMALGGVFSPHERKGEGLGYLSTAVAVGTAIGPFAGLTLARLYGFPAVFIFSGLIALLGSLIALFIGIPVTKTSKSPALRGSALSALFEARAVPASTIILLLMFAISAVLTFVSVYANTMHLRAASAYFFIVLAICTIGCRLLTGRFYDRFGANVVMYPAIFFLASGLLILGRASTSLGMLTAAALIGISYGSVVPCLQVLAFTRSPAQRTSAIAATYFTFFDLGMSAGSYLVGLCVIRLGYANIFLLLSPFVLSVGVLYFFMCGRKDQSEKKRSPLKTD